MIRYFIVPCHTILNASHTVQYIRSTNYPAVYPDNQDCQWDIHASVGYHVVLKFDDFDLGKGYGCPSHFWTDSVQIYENWRVIASLCSRNGLNKTYRSFTTRMLVKFHSNDGGRNRGFIASLKQGLLKLYLDLHNMYDVFVTHFRNEFSPYFEILLNVSITLWQCINIVFIIIN